jgi:hypothetical protein
MVDDSVVQVRAGANRIPVEVVRDILDEVFDTLSLIMLRAWVIEAIGLGLFIHCWHTLELLSWLKPI